MIIERCTSEHFEDWVRLRQALWPDDTLEEHRRYATSTLDRPDETVGYLARDECGNVVAFAEATLRRDYVNGCSTSPVGFLEGLYVQAPYRGLDFLIQRRRDAQAAKKLMVKLLKKYGFAPSRVVTDRLRSIQQRSARSGSRLSTIGACEQTTRRRIRISQYDAENKNCSGSNHRTQSNVSSPSMPPHSTHSPINVICFADRISRSFAPVHSALGRGIRRHLTPVTRYIHRY